MGVGRRRRRGGGAVSTSAGVDDESGIAGRRSFPSVLLDCKAVKKGKHTRAAHGWVRVVALRLGGGGD